jgi:hypothetical protein
MNAADIAAWVGAAAWLPQISTWVYGSFVRPLVTIVPGREAEIGFTRFGPIFNIRIAFSADRKDAIVDGMEIVLRHSDGETHVFRWAGLAETFSEISDEAGNRSVIRRDESPIALKIGTQSLVEKLVRFQEPKYHDADRQPTINLVAHFNFLKQSGDTDYVAKVLGSKEAHELVDTREKSFWWKVGQYSVQFVLSSPKKIALANERFEFEITTLDLDYLRQNIKNIEVDLRNVINSNLTEPTTEPLNWSWANVSLRRVAA